MDPVTHAVVARMAASIRRGPLSRAGAVLAGVAGLAPDLDAVFMPAGWDVYLRVHEAGTHSLAGGALLAVVLAAAARRVSAEDFGSLYLTALMAVLSHIFLDVMSGATIRLGWPLLPGRSSAGLVAMADPWLAAPVVAVLMAALATRQRLERLAPAAFVALAIVLSVKLFSRQLALGVFRPDASTPAEARHVHAQWGSLWRWWIYERTTDRVLLSSVDAWTGTTRRILERARVDTQFGAERKLTPVRNLLLAHELPVRVGVATEGRTAAFWSDLRFCFAPHPDEGPFPGSPLRPGMDPIACGVWFGGEIDADGRVVRQFVRLGGYVQER